MAFLFPADPTDGDVIVRGDILATYREQIDTWVLGQLNPVAGIPGPVGPKGEQGEKGDDGVGLNIDGTVPFYSDLPPANEVNYNEIWVVENTGHGWVWTKEGWVDLGVIIQGPQGIQGEQGIQGDKGDQGDQGPKGDPGPEGPQGNVGPEAQIPVATANTIGGIKIGRGLAIEPDGTARANRMDVVIETAPIPSDEVRDFEPIYFDMGSYTQTSFGSPGSRMAFMTAEKDIVMPQLASGAMVYMFMSSQLYPSSSRPNNYTQVVAYRAYLEHSLNVQGGIFSSNSTRMFTQTTHNLALNFINNSAVAINGRWSNEPRTKIDELLFQPGSSIKFTLQVDILTAAWCTVKGGNIRVIVCPFIDKTNQNLPDEPGPEIPPDELP